MKGFSLPTTCRPLHASEQLPQFCHKSNVIYLVQKDISSHIYGCSEMAASKTAKNTVCATITKVFITYTCQNHTKCRTNIDDLLLQHVVSPW